MTYSEFEFLAGESLEMLLFKWRRVGLIEVANMTDYQQGKGICAVYCRGLHGLWPAIRRRHENIELEKNPPHPDPKSFIHGVQTGWRRITVHAHTKCRPGGNAYPVPGIGNDVFEVIALPRQKEGGLQIGLTMLLVTAVKKGLGPPEEDRSERPELFPGWV